MDMINNVIKAMDGDQEAINKLYYATYPKLHAVAVSILKNDTDADDIVQDSYIKAFSSLHQLDNAKSFEPWLCRIVSNKCKDYLKKNKPILFSSQNTEDDSEPIEWSIEDDSKEYDPETVLISADTRRQIMELLDSLPDEQRICLVYHVVQEMKISEIAELLEVSENTVKSRINYAKSKMKVKIDELEKKGVKLRGFAGFALFPLIRYLFASESVSIPPISSEIITSSVVSAAETTAAVTETIASSSSAVIVETAKTVVGHTIKHLGVKIVSGIVAVTIATTAIIGITQPELFDRTPEVESESSKPTSSGYEIEEVTDEYIKGVFYLAQEMYDKYIYGRDVKISELSYTPNNEYIEYNGYFLEKLNDWESYEHFILNLENRFSKATVTEIISQIQLIDYEGGAFCNIKEGVGDPIYDNYRIEYVQQVSESKYRIHISFLSLTMEQETVDMYCIYENDNWVIDGLNFYNDFDSTSADSDKDVFALCEDLLRKGITESGLKIAYYAYIDLNNDDIPELLVADADGSPNSWSTCEVYTYKNDELNLCGHTNSNYDYFYIVNNKYVLGKHRMGNQFISIDECISTTNYHWDDTMSRNDPAISYNDGEWEYLTNEEFEFYQAMPDNNSLEDAFIKTADPIVLKQNSFAEN